MRQIDRVKKGRRRRAALVLVAVVIAGAGVLWALASWEVRDAEVEFPPIGRFLTVEGTRLHYVCRGEGRPVMLLHGNPGFVQDYSAVFERLRPDYRVCALDRPGHGYSSRLAEEGGDPRSQARLVHAAARKLGLERPLLVGHSWGGPLALAYALEHPEDASGLVLLAPGAYAEAGTSSALDAIQTTPVVGDLLRHVLGIPLGRRMVEEGLVKAFSPQPLPRPYLKMAKALWTRPSQELAIAEDNMGVGPAMGAMSSGYGGIRIPVTIVTGEADKLVNPKRHGYRLRRAIRGSDLMALAKTGHELPQTRPREVERAVRETWGRRRP